MTRLSALLISLLALFSIGITAAKADHTPPPAKVIHKMAFVVDRDQELIFLEPVKTVGLSRSDVEAAMKPGGKYARYRYATLAEVKKLVEDAGVRLGKSTSSADVAKAYELAQWLGAPAKCDAKSQTTCDIGISGQIRDLTRVFYVTVDLDAEGNPISSSVGSEKSGYKKATASAFFGHFLAHPFTQIDQK